MMDDAYFGLYRPLTNGENTSAEIKLNLVFIAGLALSVGLMAAAGSLIAASPMSSWFFGLLYFGMCAGVSATYLAGMKAWHWAQGTEMDTLDRIPAYGITAVGAIIGVATMGFWALAAFKDVMGLSTGGFIFAMMGMVLGACGLIELGLYAKDSYRNRTAPLGSRSDEAFEHLLSPALSEKSIPMDELRPGNDCPKPYYSDDEDDEVILIDVPVGSSSLRPSASS